MRPNVVVLIVMPNTAVTCAQYDYYVGVVCAHFEKNWFRIGQTIVVIGLPYCLRHFELFMFCFA